ncbi:hypothetical protein IQ241_07960 [Romeria aff. gracilis LEGE 07310]|uniref:Uncharacterized protein n=1 Tax=Vasconcelosia minhoensis LEGE 07310 TaxID=915328 RepID=A0A8J7DC28_9CYAN|nr:hypothetical protein [Romeria gracilis]MBE9077228.1 hypothetical protein [Romeria aff. gracilis LEGE 07310]
MMSSVLFLLLFLASLGLILVGGIISLIMPFQESVVWGLLYLFVPFASLVFLVKFWHRKWVRKSFFMVLLGSFLMGFLSALAPSFTPQDEFATSEPYSSEYATAESTDSLPQAAVSPAAAAPVDQSTAFAMRSTLLLRPHSGLRQLLLKKTGL